MRALRGRSRCQCRRKRLPKGVQRHDPRAQTESASTPQDFPGIQRQVVVFLTLLCLCVVQPHNCLRNCILLLFRFVPTIFSLAPFRSSCRQRIEKWSFATTMER
jgi:hypothetical protein